MAIATYKKAAPKLKRRDDDDFVVIDTPLKSSPLTIGDIISGFYNDISDLIVKSKLIGALIPLVLIIVGGLILYREIWPGIEEQILLATGYYNTDSVSLVAGDYVERAQFLSNPGAAYFKTLTETAVHSSKLPDDKVSENYKGRFILSIDSLGLHNLPVTANVDSGKQDVYEKYLNNGLAHFRGTGLPISTIKNNIVIYGHSSSGDYYERTRDIAGAFSRLNRIKIGDIVKIEMDGVNYEYRVTKSKVVEPDDISIINGTLNEKTLTLFTCFPNGNSAQRFVAIAKPIN